MADIQALHLWFEKKLMEVYRLMFSIAYDILDDAHQAEDAVQEAAMKAWSVLGTLEDPATVVSWLASITRNKALDMRKKRRPISADNETLDPMPGTRSDGSEAGSEGGLDFDDRRKLTELLDQLPESMRLLIRMRFFDGMSLSEIADKLGIKTNNATVRLHRAMERLRSLPGIVQLRETGVV